MFHFFPPCLKLIEEYIIYEVLLVKTYLIIIILEVTTIPFYNIGGTEMFGIVRGQILDLRDIHTGNKPPIHMIHDTSTTDNAAKSFIWKSIQG